MNEKSTNMVDSRNSIDWAMLYMRIVVGGAILLHNVSKMQNYNTIINAYQSLWGVGHATWFVLFAFIEVICAFMIIIGYRVRVAATVLTIGSLFGMIIYFSTISALEVELNAIYIFIYLLMIAMGGGCYSLDGGR